MQVNTFCPSMQSPGSREQTNWILSTKVLQGLAAFLFFKYSIIIIAAGMQAVKFCHAWNF